MGLLNDGIIILRSGLVMSLNLSIAARILPGHLFLRPGNHPTHTSKVGSAV
jgi:hypothetical protein